MTIDYFVITLYNYKVIIYERLSNMKNTRKVLCLVLSVLMLMSVMSAGAYAVDTSAGKKSAVIFVDGIASSALYDADTGDKIFPPEAKPIIKAVGKVLPTLVKDMKKNDFFATASVIADAVNPIFSSLPCDENGVPVVNTRVDYTREDENEVKAVVSGEGKRDYLYFSYDWRLPVQTIAAQLHEYIEYVMNTAELDSVSLIGFSMGTCVVMSYLKLYDYQYVDGVALLAGGYNGVSCCGQPFADMLAFDSDAIVRYTDCMFTGAGGAFGKLLIHSLNSTGALDKIIGIADKMVEDVNDTLYAEVFTKSFAALPGMWSLIPLEYYEQAKDTVINGYGFSQTYTDLIDWYHYEVQANAEDIINGCFDRGINFAVISKYGYPTTPCIEDINAMSDGVIDTRYSSFGAVCADVTGTLGEGYVQQVDNGYNSISPDNMIDASTCRFSDYTWFVKNSFHSNDMDYVVPMCIDLITAETQQNVHDSKYSQFSVLTSSGLEVMTADNAVSLYKTSYDKENMLSIFGDFIINLKNAIVKK